MANFFDMPFANGGRRAVRLVIEPWASQFLVDGGSSVIVRFAGVDSSNGFELQVDETYFTLFAPLGATDVEVRGEDGNEIEQAIQI